MKKTITAIGNIYLNEKLKGKLEILSKDILYQDGVLEILLEKKDVELLLISDELLGNYKFEEFIEKIIKLKENLEIVVFSKNSSLNIKFLNSKNIFKIYLNNEFGYEEYLRTLNDKFDKETLKANIQELKDIILSENKIISKEDNSIEHKVNKKTIIFKKYSNNLISLKSTKQEVFNTRKDNIIGQKNKSGRIIVVSGNCGARKERNYRKSSSVLE